MEGIEVVDKPEKLVIKITDQQMKSFVWNYWEPQLIVVNYSDKIYSMLSTNGRINLELVSKNLRSIVVEYRTFIAKDEFVKNKQINMNSIRSLVFIADRKNMIKRLKKNLNRNMILSDFDTIWSHANICSENVIGMYIHRES